MHNRFHILRSADKVDQIYAGLFRGMYNFPQLKELSLQYVWILLLTLES